ncbi:MAG: hypothetical protein HOV82_16900 [Streptomyces sp.]|nr:hypothetical protein [Streptomyces sp.]NUP36229.1 hypothetical protein [Streptomyces sp.]NUS75576.1 hypothetical protein [Streptomyces sp.]
MTHLPSEVAAALSLGVSAISLIALAVAFADADPCYFDPRPAVRRAVNRTRPVVWDVTRSERVYPLLREWDRARHGACEFWRDAVALLILLTTRPKGALR